MPDSFYVDYNAIASTYSVHRSASPRVISELLRHVQGTKLHRILEAGCGTADHLYILSNALNAEGYGFDQSSGMLEEASRKNPGLHLSEGDASTRFPYVDGGFDLVFSVDVIHYIRDLNRYFGEVMRALLPGGRVVTVTDSESDIQNRTLAIYFPETVENELRRYPSIDSLIEAMSRAGFEDIQRTHTEFESALDESRLERYRNRAYSSLRFVSDEGFRAGLKRMESDMRRGKCVGRELYTYVHGKKLN